MTSRLASDESGYTLIELLVAILCSVIVIFGLGAILTGVLRGTQRTFTRVNATQQGRTAIANIENELHSGCIAGGQGPIQAGSTATSLQFISYYGAQAAPTPTWHVLTYSSAAKTLTDTTFNVTTSQSGGWVTTGSGTTTTLLTNVAQRVDSSGNPIPVFQYFAYASGTSDAGGTYWFVHDGATSDPGTPGAAPAAAAPLALGSSGLSADQATSTVEVGINFSVGANSESINNPSLTAVNDQVSDAISLRLTSPPDEVDSADTPTTGQEPAGYGPCE